MDVNASADVSIAAVAGTARMVRTEAWWGWHRMGCQFLANMGIPLRVGEAAVQPRLPRCDGVVEPGGAAPRSPSVRPWTWSAHLGDGPPRASPSRRKRRWMSQVGCET